MDTRGTNRAHPIHEQRSLSKNTPVGPSTSAAGMVCPVLVSTTPPQQTATARGMGVQHRGFFAAGVETCSMDKATASTPDHQPLCDIPTCQ